MTNSAGLSAGDRAIPQSSKAGRALNWSRIAKLFGAAATLAIGAYAILGDQVSIATDNAVVSAYAVAIRAPIEGIINGESLRIGGPINQGATLAQVTNTRVDDQHLVDLREHLTRTRAQLASISGEENSLGALRDELNLRTQAYLDATANRLAGSIAEAQNTLSALNDRRDQAARVLSRRKALISTGSTTAADLDQAQSDFDVASHQVTAQEGQLRSIQAQAASIAQGVISEPGSNDVTYSKQRSDEVAIRLQDLEQQRMLLLADIDETSGRLKSESDRIEQLRKAVMTAPTAGMVWKLGASDGERVAAGDMIAQVVDCGASFIIAEVPQSRVPDIEVGSEAEYRLSGDLVTYHGRVVSVTGDATGGDKNLAAIPFDQRGPMATARIAMAAPAGQCAVGRTARVVLPSKGPGLLFRLFHLLG